VKMAAKRSFTKARIEGTVRRLAVRGRTSPPEAWIRRLTSSETAMSARRKR